jgi:hypothetical protein
VEELAFLLFQVEDGSAHRTTLTQIAGTSATIEDAPFSSPFGRVGFDPFRGQPFLVGSLVPGVVLYTPAFVGWGGQQIISDPSDSVVAKSVGVEPTGGGVTVLLGQGTGPVSLAASRASWTQIGLSPEHSGDYAMALDSVGLTYVAFWTLDPNNNRILNLVTGDAASSNMIAVYPGPDPGSKLAIAALEGGGGSATVVLNTSVDLSAITAEPPLPSNAFSIAPLIGAPSGSCSSCNGTCVETARGAIPGAHAMSSDVNGAWLAYAVQSISRTLSQTPVCAGTSCVCHRTAVSDTSSVSLSFARIQSPGLVSVAAQGIPLALVPEELDVSVAPDQAILMLAVSSGSKVIYLEFESAGL